MPSEIDIHAAARCISDLLLVAKVRRSQGRLGIIADRVRSNTLISETLMRFLRSLDIPLVATLRDTQNYVRSVQIGAGIHEMPEWQVRRDLDEWAPLVDWLDSRRPVPGPPLAAESSYPDGGETERLSPAEAAV